MSGDRILLVDDEEAILSSTARLLDQGGLGPCLLANTGRSAFEVLRVEAVGVVLLDLGLPDIPGEIVLDRIRSDHPEVLVVIVTALGDLDTAVRCMGAGAYDYIVKGRDPARLEATIKRALETRRRSRDFAVFRERMLSTSLKSPKAFAPIVTNSDLIRALFRFIEAVAQTDEPILIQGETGTGKELFARAVHVASQSKGPFVATNLGGLDDFMVSDTLFGHTKGAYTGADSVRKGLVATAEGGTLFLDEIGELSPTTQVKLLRFLEDRQYYPLGSDVARRSNARIVVATNRDLVALSETGNFRRDLLFRLSTYRLDIPPLRQRPEDIPALCHHFLATLGSQDSPVSLSSGALAALGQYAFPGNVRELRGLLLRAKVSARGPVLDLSAFETLAPAATGALSKLDGADLRFSGPLPTIRSVVADLIAEALRRTGGQQNLAASLLGITPQALSKRLRGSERAER